MENKINVAAIQMYVTKSQKENLKIMEEHLAHIHKVFSHIDMVIFPELSPMNIGSKIEKNSQNIPGE